VKEIFEKVGLSEFFAYVCPGVILFSSLALWVRPQAITDFFGNSIIGHEFLIIIFILIFCYTLGLIVASWSSGGGNLYIRLKRRGRTLKTRKDMVLQWLLWIPHGLPEPRSNASTVEGSLRMAEDLQGYSGLQGLSLFETPWDWLVLYRIVMTDRVGDQGRSILTEADSIHRRFLFCQAVAFAFFLVATQSFIRYLLLDTCLNNLFPSISPLGLVVITLLGGFTSFGLRNVAGRWWEHELVLTSSISQIQI
jgi:hypothetical protein